MNNETSNPIQMNEQITLTFDTAMAATINTALATTSYLPTETVMLDAATSIDPVYPHPNMEMPVFTPYPSHTTQLMASLYASCAVVACTQQANPLNTVEASLDIFGSPVVCVRMCDDHYRLFGAVTEEHEKPDIVLNGGVIPDGQIAIVGEGEDDE